MKLPNRKRRSKSDMNKLVFKVALAVVALAGIAGVVYYFTRPSAVTKTVVPEIEESKKRDTVPVPKVTFTDITKQAGINFTHVSGATGRKLLPETMGSGCAFFDFDNDGKPDLLLINSRPWPGSKDPVPTMKLYRNKGNDNFEDVTAAVGLDIPLFGMGVAIGDYDNDGWPDIFITAVGGCKLFRNIGGKHFEDVTEKAGVAGGKWPSGTAEEFLNSETPIPWATSATFVDYDGDGKLDLFVCHYLSWSPKGDLDNKFMLLGDVRAYGRPKEFDGTHCTLYRNKGDGTFEDVSEKAGIHVNRPDGIASDARQRAAGKALGVIVCDPDDDGWPDLIVANDTVENFFFHNVAGPDGTRVFKEEARSAGLAVVDGLTRGGMGIDWAEFLPGRRCVAIANFSNEPTSFFCQVRPQRAKFEEQARGVGLIGPTLAPLKFGTFFFDYDLDGRPDLLTNNGHLEPDIQKKDANQKFAQEPQLFWNTGRRSGCFEPVTQTDAGSDLFVPLVGRGSAYADIDGDGDIDVVLTSNGGPARLLRNDNNLKHHWVRLTLEGDGKRSNRSAIGAGVTLEAGGKTQTQMVAGAKGYLSQSEFTLTFGLGDTAKIDKVTIRWPGKNAGAPTVLTDIAVDKVHRIKQH